MYSFKEDICPICLMGEPNLTLYCKHKMHEDCLWELIENGFQECPLCRKKITFSFSMLLRKNVLWTRFLYLNKLILFLVPIYCLIRLSHYSILPVYLSFFTTFVIFQFCISR